MDASAHCLCVYGESGNYTISSGRMAGRIDVSGENGKIASSCGLLGGTREAHCRIFGAKVQTIHSHTGFRWVIAAALCLSRRVGIAGHSIFNFAIASDGSRVGTNTTRSGHVCLEPWSHSRCTKTTHRLCGMAQETCANIGVCASWQCNASTGSLIFVWRRRRRGGPIVAKTKRVCTAPRKVRYQSCASYGVASSCFCSCCFEHFRRQALVTAF